MRILFLDAGPLGLMSNPRATPQSVSCRRWAEDLLTFGARIVVPEITDYEVRRELLRVGATTGLRRLDQIKSGFEYAPITTEVMHFAAELWAAARKAGKPTASSDALDGDCILAAQALLSTGTGDTVTVATGNVGHLSRFVDARQWEAITK